MVVKRDATTRDWLDKLTGEAKKRVSIGYYETKKDEVQPPPNQLSFQEAIDRKKGNSIIAEVKFGSPSRGRFETAYEKPEDLLAAYQKGGACGYSVLTDPEYFYGSLEDLKIAGGKNEPVLMKDFIVSPKQIKACYQLGGSCVLLIFTLFEREYPEIDLDRAIEIAHDRNLETLLEVTSAREYSKALRTNSDMIGINNRNLEDLSIDLNKTERILESLGKDRIVWSLSGIQTPGELKRVKRSGADAFLIGSSLIEAPNPETRLEELKNA